MSKISSNQYDLDEFPNEEEEEIEDDLIKMEEYCELTISDAEDPENSKGKNLNSSINSPSNPLSMNRLNSNNDNDNIKDDKKENSKNNSIDMKDLYEEKINIENDDNNNGNKVNKRNDNNNNHENNSIDMYDLYEEKIPQKNKEEENNNNIKNNENNINNIQPNENYNFNKQIFENNKNENNYNNNIQNNQIKKNSYEKSKKNSINIKKSKSKPNFQNNNTNKTKTVFSLLSEEVTNTILSKRDKINPFEALMNEVELQKINKKLNKNNKNIVDDFLNRNKNDTKLRQYKKKINLSQRNNESTNLTKGINYLTINHNNNTTNNLSNRPQSPLSYNSSRNNETNNNIKEKQKMKVRSPEKFYSDQIQWEENKRKNEEIQRLKSIEKEDKLSTNKPKMNKYSLQLARKRFSPTKDFKTKRNYGNNNSNIIGSSAFENYNANLLKFFKSKTNNHIIDPHKRLNKTTIRNFKNDNENKIKNIYSSPRNKKKLPRKNIDELIEKLFSEKKAEDKINKNNNKIKEPKEISNSSNIVLLRSFLKSLYFKIKEFDLVNDFEEKNKNYNTITIDTNVNNHTNNNNSLNNKGPSITFEQFHNILEKMGFIKKFENNNNKITENAYTLSHNNTMDKNNKKDLNKSKGFINNNTSGNLVNLNTNNINTHNSNMKLLNDAWDILSSINSEKYGIYRVDFNLMIVFLLVILGIYRGNDKLNDEIFYLKNKENLRTIELTNKDIENYNLLTDKTNLNINQENNNNNNQKNTYSKQNSNNSNNNNNITNNNSNNNNKDNFFSVTFSTLGKNNNNNSVINSNQNFKETQKSNLQKIENNFKLETINPEGNNNNINNLNNLNNLDIINSDFRMTINKNLYLNTIANDIKIYFPNFDKSYFIFKNESTSNIRSLYREFYENWADRNFENMRQKRSYSSGSYTERESKRNFSFKPHIGKASLNLAEKSRLRYDSANMSNLSSNDNNNANLRVHSVSNCNLNTTGNNRRNRTPRVEEFYDKINLKKTM